MALDLCSGTGSVGRQLSKRGYKVVSVDVRAVCNPTICVDLLKWDYTKYKPGTFEVIAASPPCTEYSQAKTTRPRDMAKADVLVARVLEIVRYFRPRLWWVENPRTGLLKTRSVIKGLKWLDLDYCQFSDWGYKKPTRFWCSPAIASLNPVLCDPRSCPNVEESTKGTYKHRETLGGQGMKTSSQQKGRVPAGVVDYLLSAPKVSKKGSPRSPKSTESPQALSSGGEAILVPERCLRAHNSYNLGKVNLVGDDMQLMLELDVYLPNGCSKRVKALVDTGAQINLVRRRLVPNHLLSWARQTVKLVAANQQLIEGGDKMVSLQLEFRLSGKSKGAMDFALFEGEFYEANIDVDMILSYPWLRENRLGVFPHHNALAIDEPHFLLLQGGTPHVKRRSSKCKRGRASGKESRSPSGNHRQLRAVIGGDNPMTNPNAEGWEDTLQFVRKLGLTLPPEGVTPEVEPLNSHDTRHVARVLRAADCDPSFSIRPIILANEGENVDPRVLALREAIHKDYDGEVFAKEVLPNPPIRGPYGLAFIPLKEGAIPQRTRPFVMQGEKLEAHKKITQQWREANFIERPPKGVALEWLSSTFPVPKKSADFPWRGVFDARGLNSQTSRVSYPLPVIEDLLVKQGAKTMFSILDLRQAFHQQPLDPQSRPLTACYTPEGVYQWRVNVMGLANASQQFQMMMEDRLQSLRGIADPYIDDILVGTQVMAGEDLLAAHDRDLRQVLEQCKVDRFIIDPRKAQLFVSEVEFCGHILGGGTRRPAPGKLRAIEKWEVPQTITGLRAFLGFTNYYSTYIKDYGKIVARLQDKLKVPKAEGKKGSKKLISWDPQDLEAFHELKRRLCSELILQRVNPDKPFILRTDASGYAVGATLEQLLDEDRKPTVEDVREQRTVPVAFMSRKLTGSQRNWVPRELETYAIICALQKWESWIGFQPVLVLTDHKSLEHWAKEVLDVPSGPLGRRSRWHQLLSKFDLSVGYIPGKENTIADVMSRWAYPASQAFWDVSKHGSVHDQEEMRRLISEEKEDEKSCLWIKLKHPPLERNLFVRGVTTRGGATTQGDDDSQDTGMDESTRSGDGKGPVQGLATRPLDTPPPAPPKGKKVTFSDPLVANATKSQGGEPPRDTEKPQARMELGKRGESQKNLGRRPVHPPSQDLVPPLSPVPPTPSSHPAKPNGEAGGDEAGEGLEGLGSAATRCGTPGPQTQSQGSSSHEGNLEEEDPSSHTGLAVDAHAECTSDEERQPVWDVNWGDAYMKCPKWSLVHGSLDKGDWPKGLKVHEGRMFLNEKLCIPLPLQKRIIRDYHSFLGHPGFPRLWDAMDLRYEWGDSKLAKSFAKEVIQHCETCQACQYPRFRKGIVEPTPIPPMPMASVALDNFKMTPVVFEGQSYDSMALCVDRHSGWIIAVPCLNKGLTGSKVAKLMLQHQWRPFGIPSIITSDKGSQFVSAWWQTMCSLLGIRQAYSHVYNHRANGRAEKAGQQLIERIKRLQIEDKLNWVEALPQVLDRLHDTPGESGLSPYQILFGRCRPLAGIPYTPPTECEDAQRFFQRQRQIDEHVAKRLNDLHAKQFAVANRGKVAQSALSVGDKVWYLRPENSGTKLDSRWLGPALVTAREGEFSYKVELKPGHVVGAHRDCLKLYRMDELTSDPIPLYFHRRTVPDPEAVPDEWIVDEIIGHRQEPNGSYKFLTKWVGFEDATWEPIQNFIHRYSADWVRYCQKRGIAVDLLAALSPSVARD